VQLLQVFYSNKTKGVLLSNRQVVANLIVQVQLGLWEFLKYVGELAVT